ncbi:uncharacterized protein C8Q71DRAFT_770636 [Rhodofomes roseus]|uniref:F-box domain-containing protein n=1 Tax=Rhodofomes roseus TaxID=34475 RepID=A0ABQ8K9P9_9APHY|nr:uncharacterized protein C8Q71DRAFT_770636 [Rhodofomes roseus]KAH9834023.1 hypothetical protein C8Q71DRAFT_770636 [Rhodofomes roseus]
MHQALLIPELFRLILIKIRSKQSLLTLALACRALHEHALDTLWTCPEDLSDLVKLLPSDLWRYSGIGPGRIMELKSPTRPTGPQDWERFDFYARRVRKLEFSPEFSLALSNDLFHWLTSSRPSQLLLPNLSDICWVASDSSEYHDSLYVLFGPRLIALRLEVWEAESAASQTAPFALLQLPQCSPDIETLRFLGPHDCEALPAGVLASLKKLRAVNLCLPLTLDAFAELSTLRALSQLEINLSFFDDKVLIASQAVGLRTAQTLAFDALKKLVLIMPMTAASAILSRCRFPQLGQIVLRTRSASNVEPLHSVLQLICQCCNHAVLHDIHIDIGKSANPDEHVIYTLTAASLRPLCHFHHLRTFKLVTAQVFIVLDDEAVKEMSMSWPLLECLQLMTAVEDPWATPTQTATTLDGLAHLARYCPSLQELAIDVDTAGATVSARVKPGGGFCNYALRRITIPRFPMLSDCAEIGAFLHAIFPNLRQIAVPPGFENSPWKAVEVVLRGIWIVSQWEKSTGLRA